MEEEATPAVAAGQTTRDAGSTAAAESDQKHVQSLDSTQANELDGGTVLFREISNPDLTLFECIARLSYSRESVGIQYRICERLKQFPLDQTAFYLPQLVQLFVTVETESTALEDLLLELCQQSTHVTLVVFWHLQASLADFADQPKSYAFSVSKSLYNKLQHILFALGEAPDTVNKENPQPAIMLMSMVASMLVPSVGTQMKPLVVSQGRRRLLGWLHRVAETQTRRSSTPPPVAQALSLGTRAAKSVPNLSIDHLPDLSNHENGLGAGSHKLGLGRSYTNAASRLSGGIERTTPEARLRTNYFRNEAQFLYALQSISNRLLQVPKPARLSALQLELALLNRDLPAEVDLPTLLPVTRDGRQSRIVRIAPTEATVLNSAEKAPFLLLVEYLRGDLTFDKTSKRNKIILAHSESGPPLFERNLSTSVSPMTSTTVPELSTVSSPKASTSTSIEKEPLERLEVPSGASHDGEPRPSSSSILTAAAVIARCETRSEIDSDDEEEELRNGNGLARYEVSDDEEDISKLSLVELAEMNYFTVSNDNDPQQRARTPLPISQAELDAAQIVQENAGAGSLDIADLATQMRTASVILSQLDSTRLPRGEVDAIKSKIVTSMQGMQDHHSFLQGEAGERKLENDLKTAGLSTANDDPSAANLGEDWQSRKTRIRKSSPFGQDPRWDLFSVIVKTGDDLRQEALASQLIMRASRIWKAAGVPVWVKRMRILITSGNSGLVETITNGLSLHSIKKALTTANVANGGDPRQIAQLSQHFDHKFGSDLSSIKRHHALENFIKSLAAYSLLCYLLQIKDRHNGNILVDSDGHIIHIDFGFMLSNAPGHIGFEAAPFKLTQEYVDLMGGPSSKWYAEYVRLIQLAFRELRRHADEIVAFVDIMSRSSKLPCFMNGPSTSQQLKQRFMCHLTDAELDTFVERLVSKSYGSVYTRIYDQYQLVTQGIYS